MHPSPSLCIDFFQPIPLLLQTSFQSHLPYELVSWQVQESALDKSNIASLYMYKEYIKLPPLPPL